MIARAALATHALIRSCPLRRVPVIGARASRSVADNVAHCGLFGLTGGKDRLAVIPGIKVEVSLCSAEVERGCDLLVAAAHHLGRAPRTVAAVHHVPVHARAPRALSQPFRMPPLMCRLATSASCGGRKSERVDAALGQEKVGGVRRLRFERGERQRARDWVLVATRERCRCAPPIFAAPPIHSTSRERLPLLL